MSAMSSAETPLPHVAPHVVLVHGAWHGAWCWRDGFAQRLEAAGLQVTTPDLPGHGSLLDAPRLRSLRHGPRLRDYVDSVVEVLRGLPAGGPPPVVVGHSMGGGVVQHLVGRLHRPALSGAVLLASMPPAGVWRVTLDTARQRTGTFLAANVRRDLGMLVVEPEHVRRMFLSADTDDAVVAGVQSRLHGESFRAFLDMLALDRPRPASGRGPRATEVRVLGAADDTIFRVADVEATAAAWGTEAVIVPGIGHDVMLDHGWERVADQVITWVREMA